MLTAYVQTIEYPSEYVQAISNINDEVEYLNQFNV